MEKKLFKIDEVKFASSDDETKTFSGYGAVFGNVDSYGDVLAKGAFRKTLKADATPLMFLNHDPYSLPIGKWTKLEEDEFGLKVEGQFLDTSAGRDAYVASKAGAITGLSIGFRPIETQMGKPNTDEARRTIKSVELLEISVVTFPANGKARIGNVKSFASDDDFERELIHLGMNREEAKNFLAAHGNTIEHKYNEAVTHRVARHLLSKLQGA
jgi:HK97 family phage prohead protease